MYKKKKSTEEKGGEENRIWRMDGDLKISNLEEHMKPKEIGNKPQNESLCEKKKKKKRKKKS